MNNQDEIQNSEIQIEMDPVSEGSAPTQPSADESAETSISEDSSQDTGEASEVQAQPQTEESGTPEAAVYEASEKEKTWIDHLEIFHNDINGLLAAKENLKLVAVNVSARQSFYKKWSLEANQTMRITAILRRRLQAAKKTAP